MARRRRVAGEARHALDGDDRADYLSNTSTKWKSQGLAGVMIGIESLTQEGLNALEKAKRSGEALRGRGTVPRHGRDGRFSSSDRNRHEESIRADLGNWRRRGST